jgi:putative ABC transport system permease protein
VATTAIGSFQPKSSLLSDTISLAYDTFRMNRVRFGLSSVGMMIGTASLILVVTMGITGKRYVVDQIQSIGTNMIDVEYQSGGQDTNPDRLTYTDLKAVQQQVYGIVAASPIVPLDVRIPSGGGKEAEVRLLGVLPEYRTVRNLVVTSGRFMDGTDERARTKVGVMQTKLARKLYGSVDAVPGKVVILYDLPFTLIGTFDEKVDTFGQSEVTENSILVPYSVSRYFTNTDEVNQLYFSTTDPSLVTSVTQQIRDVVIARHRPESNYTVENLTSLIQVADQASNTMTLVLLLISAVALIVGGIGIMNIMLLSVTSRTHEIGIRRAVGASQSDIWRQFLGEALFMSSVGGFSGVFVGVMLPVSLRLLTHYRFPVSVTSVVVAVVVSAMIGIGFGTMPATRAARLDPVASLRHEG